jgi:gliding motility-associated-like protein
VDVIDANDCITSQQIVIIQPPQLFVEAGPDVTVELGFSTNLRAVVSPPGWPVSFSWSPSEDLSCPDCPNPEATPPNTTTYRVTVTDPNGCTALDSVTVFVEKVRDLFAPNAFTPNEDGNNDFFTIFGGPGAEKINILRIYNRWGNQVFEARDVPLNTALYGWDGSQRGKLLPPDVFAYYAEVQFIDREIVLIKGDVPIVR